MYGYWQGTYALKISDTKRQSNAVITRMQWEQSIVPVNYNRGIILK